MPARDLYHDAVKAALLKDGWTITHDPFTLTFGRRRVFVDLGAERMFAAERGKEKIAVEVKSFVGPSELRDIEQALGQFVLYQALLSEYEPDRTLVLAVPVDAYIELIEGMLPRSVIAHTNLRCFAFDPVQEVITTWMP
jgi:hypothetical protein